MAKKLLEDNNVMEAPIPVKKIAEKLGVTIRYSPFDGELAGMLVRDENQSSVIGVNSLHHINRQRFMIAHEIGHLLLHKGSLHIDKSFRVNLRDGESSKARNPKEIEANRFAAELLMPYEMIRSDLTNREIDIEDEDQLKELANSYQVSVQALTHRISYLLRDVS